MRRLLAALIALAPLSAHAQIGLPAGLAQLMPAIPATPTITGVSFASGGTYACGGPSGQNVGTLQVNMTGGSFTGTIAMSGTASGRFSLSGNTLSTAAVDCDTYASTAKLAITPTQAGATGSGTLFAISPAAQGLGDIQTANQVAYYGMRAFTQALAAAGTTKLFQMANVSAGSTCDVLAATTGGLGLTVNCSNSSDNGKTPGTYQGSAGNGRITIWYNQVSGGACNLAQTTAANRPYFEVTTGTISVAWQNSPPVITYMECSQALIGAPVTIVAAIQPDTSASSSAALVVFSHLDRLGSSVTLRSIDYNSYADTGGLANKIGVFNANNNSYSSVAASSGTLASGAWGAIAGLFASGTSRMAYLTGVAGTPNTDSIIPGTLNSFVLGAMGSTGLLNYYHGLVAEVGYWSTDMTAVLPAICKNQYKYGYSAAAC